MRISDWSSDVCSSDLGIDRFLRFVTAPTCCRRLCEAGSGCERTKMSHYPALELLIAGERLGCAGRETIDVLDPAPDRKSVVKGKSVSVRVELGGGRQIKKKKMYNKK